jgi:hypothetical protein
LDGTSWTEVADLATAVEINKVHKMEELLSCFSMAGETALLITDYTEEWTAPDVVINTLTTS